MITTRYYYSILSEQEKKIYKAIYDGIKNYKPYVEVPGIPLSNQSVGFVYHCVLWDNPYFFTVGEYAMQQAVSADGKRIKITTLCDARAEQRYRSEIQNIINTILKTSGLSLIFHFCFKKSFSSKSIVE